MIVETGPLVAALNRRDANHRVLDNVYYPVMDDTEGRPYAAFVHGNSDTTGAVRAIESITTGMGWKRVRDPVTVIGEPSRTDLDACWELGAVVAFQLGGLRGRWSRSGVQPVERGVDGTSVARRVCFVAVGDTMPDVRGTAMHLCVPLLGPGQGSGGSGHTAATPSTPGTGDRARAFFRRRHCPDPVFAVAAVADSLSAEVALWLPLTTRALSSMMMSSLALRRQGRTAP